MKLPKRASAAHVVPAIREYVRVHFNQPDTEDRLAASFLDNWLTDFERGARAEEMLVALTNPSYASIQTMHVSLSLWLSAVRVNCRRREAADRLAWVEVFLKRRVELQGADSGRAICV